MLSEYNYQQLDSTYTANTSWSPNQYKILHDGSGDSTFAADGTQATLVYLVEFSAFEAFIDVILGKTVKVGAALSRSSSNGAFDGNSGSLPEPHPFIANLYATSAHMVPYGAPIHNSPPCWSKAKVTVVFRPLDFNVISDAGLGGNSEMTRFTSKTPEGGVDALTNPGLFKFVGSGRVLDTQPALFIPNLKYTYTWHRIPVLMNGNVPNLGTIPNYSTISGLLGCVNSAAFDGYPKGTVLFISWSPKLILPSTATRGAYYWDLSYVFGFRWYGTSPYDGTQGIGWQFVYDPLKGGSPGFDLVSSDGTTSGRLQYPTGDLTTLFNVTW